MLELIKQCLSGQHYSLQIIEKVHLRFRDKVLEAIHPDVRVRFLKIEALQRHMRNSLGGDHINTINTYILTAI